MPAWVARQAGIYSRFPERIVRAAAAVLGGTLHETGTLLLPRFVRRSRLYEATAANLLRIMIELVGGVEGAPTAKAEATAGEIAVRKGAGNVVELGSIAAFGFSPLWLLAGTSDVLHGSRVYLNTLVDELKRAGVVGDELDVDSVDDLLRALEEGSGGTARLIDIPPVELAGLRASLAELRVSAETLPSPAELAALLAALRRTAAAERRTLLEVSVGVGLAFLSSARSISREHVALPYREDLTPVRDEGFGAYASAGLEAVCARDRLALRPGEPDADRPRARPPPAYALPRFSAGSAAGTHPARCGSEGRPRDAVPARNDEERQPLSRRRRARRSDRRVPLRLRHRASSEAPSSSSRRI